MKSALPFLSHDTAIYKQNSSKPTCFTACAIAMLSCFFVLLFYDGHSDLVTWLARLRDSKSKKQDYETSFIFFILDWDSKTPENLQRPIFFPGPFLIPLIPKVCIIINFVKNECSGFFIKAPDSRLPPLSLGC